MSTADDPVTRELVSEWLTLKEEQDKRAQQMEELTAFILRRVDPGEAVEILPGVGVRVQGPTRRFNADLARELLDDEDFESICEVVPSVKLLRQALPDMVDLCCPATGRAFLRRL